MQQDEKYKSASINIEAIRKRIALIHWFQIDMILDIFRPRILAAKCVLPDPI